MSNNEVGEVHDARPKVHFSMLSSLGVQFSITGAPLTLGTESREREKRKEERAWEVREEVQSQVTVVTK
ncbi:hypothetical protein N7532_002926 [Penicillium argentinense]|uniref:Uncharacterized protein n=1 Tax=Penicillium argentinense TaxID=1131581 RepID=A0A9W9KLN1_9EURO|nr:uncharacterized protein N7532_002926 [Penicillium argentinense]KAJ5110281.1 hypothetical protein N7532_002926 [Penicillium argentinense]